MTRAARGACAPVIQSARARLRPDEWLVGRGSGNPSEPSTTGTPNGMTSPLWWTSPLIRRCDGLGLALSAYTQAIMGWGLSFSRLFNLCSSSEIVLRSSSVATSRTAPRTRLRSRSSMFCCSLERRSGASGIASIVRASCFSFSFAFRPSGKPSLAQRSRIGAQNCSSISRCGSRVER